MSDREWTATLFLSLRSLHPCHPLLHSAVLGGVDTEVSGTLMGGEAQPRHYFGGGVIPATGPLMGPPRPPPPPADYAPPTAIGGPFYDEEAMGWYWEVDDLYQDDEGHVFFLDSPPSPNGGVAGVPRNMNRPVRRASCCFRCLFWE